MGFLLLYFTIPDYPQNTITAQEGPSPCLLITAPPGGLHMLSSQPMRQKHFQIIE